MIKAPEDRYRIVLDPRSYLAGGGYRILYGLNEEDAIELLAYRYFATEAEAQVEVARLVEEDYAEQAARDKWENDR